MEVRDLLIGVQALLVDASHWTQNANARASFGATADDVEPWDDRATRWCLYGACAKVCGASGWANIADNVPEYTGAINALQYVAANKVGGRDPLYVNDNLGHGAMLVLLGETIKHVEAHPDNYKLPVPA